ncbi:hypothetical protein G9P44_005703 [Scheffersomyces stipitis]|nr:hypothetical protein G9P44_005703 [Scheffersomyces stipitis]
MSENTLHQKPAPESSSPNKNIKNLSIAVNNSATSNTEKESVKTPVVMTASTNTPSAPIPDPPAPVLHPLHPDPSTTSFKVPKKILVSENKDLVNNIRMPSLSQSSSAILNSNEASHNYNNNSNTGNSNINNNINNSSNNNATNNTNTTNTTSNNMTNVAVSGPNSTAGTGPVSNIPSTSATPTIPNSMLNKSIISSLNKSLKAKQKIISNREPHPKNPTLISDILNTSPQSTIFPNNISSTNNSTLELDSDSGVTSSKAGASHLGSNAGAPISTHQAPNSSTMATPNPNAAFLLHPNSSTTNVAHASGSSQSNSNSNAAPVATLTEVSNDNSNDAGVAESQTSAASKPPPSKGKQKKISKQNSTRTDFFAAKLASAVDDVESSDSDETFVYENNNDFETMSTTMATPNVANDASSVHGSVLASALQMGGAPSFHSPSIAEGHTGGESIAVQPVESIHSTHSSKLPKIQAHATSNRPPSIANSFTSNYLESVANSANSNINKDKRPAYQRSFSSYSQDEHPGAKLQVPCERSSNNISPSGALDEINSQSHAPQGLGIEGRSDHPSQSNSHVARSINDGYNDDNFSYNEVEDVEIDDEMSTDGDFYAQRNASANPQFGGVSGTTNITNNQASQTNNSLTSRSTSKKNYKSSTSSSKLRSTTSKLFDKKGSQPRRYSIIPDDIDIEDFDDELIYYDKNIRFPYNNSNVNEASPLMSQGHRLPHYRSLNLNFPGAKRPSGLKKKRYLSTGQSLIPGAENSGANSPSNVSSHNADIFPFPYQEPQQNYYYDFDEYDEESQRNGSNDKDQINRSISRGTKNGLYNHNLTASEGHFFLPRKQSSEFNYHRINCIKSFIYTLVSILVILAIGFVMGFVLATTKDLTKVSITSIENAVVSQDELVFNIVVEAFNPGWFTVEIEDVNLDLFAKSGYLPDASVQSLEEGGLDDEMSSLANGVETVLLGTVYTLESPMSFKGGFFSRESVIQSGEIKLLTPGKNLTTLNNFAKGKKGHNGNSTEPDNSKKWEIISKNPFDLVVRGILMYTLPMGKDTRSVVVDKIGYIDPTQIFSSNVEK